MRQRPPVSATFQPFELGHFRPGIEPLRGYGRCLNNPNCIIYLTMYLDMILVAHDFQGLCSDVDLWALSSP